MQPSEQYIPTFIILPCWPSGKASQDNLIQYKKRLPKAISFHSFLTLSVTSDGYMETVFKLDNTL
jgi:hypothetical protein